jgi:selenide,water dikinase
MLLKMHASFVNLPKQLQSNNTHSIYFIMETPIRLTQYSHGAGCGCKISPQILDKILQSNETFPNNERLLVGNHSRDDAAVYDLGNGTALISTTDFFMPIVDDPFLFGRIASANAISDVYAMGGKPIMAIAILGWTLDKLPPEIAQKVIEGSRSICAEAGIPLAGGHSIDSPEPIFGLAVSGLVNITHLKKNNTAKEGNILFLTKPLGVGILTTAEKRGILRQSDQGLATTQMMKLNSIGELLGAIEGVTALTDVTGFGLLGHLCEMCDGSNLSAIVEYENIPILNGVEFYREQGAIPGGTHRNWSSYGHKIAPITNNQRAILADPQTSGGLLLAVEPNAVNYLQSLFIENGLTNSINPIGTLRKRGDFAVWVE